VKVGGRAQTSGAGQVALGESATTEKRAAAETGALVTEALAAKLENSASREDRPVVEVAADSTAAAVVAKEDLVGENAAEVEVEAEVPVSCHPEETLE
jgi:hypothetical protein